MTQTVWVVTCGEYPKQAYWQKENAYHEVKEGDAVCLGYHDATEVVVFDEEFNLNDEQHRVMQKYCDKYLEPYPLFDCLQLMFTDEGLSDCEYAKTAKAFIEWTIEENEEDGE